MMQKWLFVIIIILFSVLLLSFILSFLHLTVRKESLQNNTWDSHLEKMSLPEWHQTLRNHAKRTSAETVTRFAPLPILCIHLTRSHDRAKHIQDQQLVLPGLDIQKIKAVDRLQIPNLQHIRVDEFDFDASSLKHSEPALESRKAAVSCLLSHLRAIMYAWQHKLGTVCVCEDDSSFFLLPYWSKTWTEIVHNAPKKWNMILLYNNGIGVDIKVSPELEYTTASDSNGTVAYLISVNGQEKIASLFDNHNRLTKMPNLSTYASSDSFLYALLSPHVYCVNIPLVYPYNQDHFCNSLIHKNHLPHHQDRAKKIIVSHYKNLNKIAQPRFQRKPPLWSCWVGNNPIPPYLQMCHQSIKKYNQPYFDVILVTPQNLHHFLQDIHPAYYYLSYNHKADYLRVCLLYHYGGMYVDMDTIGFRPLKEELHVSHSVDVVGYDGQQWGELWGFGALGPVQPYNSLYTFWKENIHRVLDKQETKLKQFRHDHPENWFKDAFTWTMLTRDIILPYQTSMEYSKYITKSWQPDYVNGHEVIRPISSGKWKTIIQKIMTLPVLMLNHSTYSSEIQNASPETIKQSDILIFRLLQHALEKPFVFAYPYIDKIMYINIDHRLDRKKETLDELHKYFNPQAIMRIPAIATPENGHYGCLQSHIRALQKCKLDFPYENVLLCEDDVKFMISPLPIFDRFFRDPSTHDWDVLLLNHSKKEIFFRVEKTPSPFFVRVLETQSACCYLIRDRYVSTLLDLFQHVLDEYHHSKVWKDHYCVDQCWKQLQTKHKWYAYRQRVAKQRKSLSSISHQMFEYYSSLPMC